MVLARFVPLAAVLMGAPLLGAQAASGGASPVAIVTLDGSLPGSAAMVTGAVEISHGQATLASSGSIISGSNTALVTLPHRGVLRVCPATSVKLAADSSVPPGEMPGLLIAMEHGAIETSTSTGRNSDIVLTPDFRILIGAPGAAEVKVRLGQHGDTCVDNSGDTAPYVLVTSVFEGGTYHVQAGQRVMFQHGSLHNVVSHDVEPCGCPPSASDGNAFPLAQNSGPSPLAVAVTGSQPPAAGALVYNGADHPSQPVAGGQQSSGANSPPEPDPIASVFKFFAKVGHSIWHFFRHIFGAE